jgi:NADH-quinone oxidoreductase subunit J
MADLTLVDVLFYIVAALTVGCGAYAVFSRNIVRAVFSLLGTFFGVAVLYGFLAADFVAIVQVLVYVGGILVLLLFAVMLTSNIETVEESSRSGSVLIGSAVGIGLAVLLIILAVRVPWAKFEGTEFAPTTSDIGDVLLREALLPFELVSIVLLGVVIGAVVIARFRGTGETPEGGGEGEAQS